MFVTIQSLRLAAIFLFGAGLASAATADPVRIVVLGDSLTAGFGLSAEDTFTSRLQSALEAKGHDVVVVNAGVSGDTASDALARVDWSVGADADAAIVEIGANDALRGLDPALTRRSVDGLVGRLTGRGLPVLVAGMLAPPNLGADYAAAFDAIYPDVAKKYGALIYPFFLDGVATRAELNQGDGLHPNKAGTAIVVERILPSVESLIERVRQPHAEAASGALIPEASNERGEPSCHACSPASRFPLTSATVSLSSAGGFPGRAGSTGRTIT